MRSNFFDDKDLPFTKAVGGICAKTYNGGVELSPTHHNETRMLLETMSRYFWRILVVNSLFGTAAARKPLKFMHITKTGGTA